MFLFSELARPATYIRLIIKQVFKQFINDISDDFLGKICDIIKSGDVIIDAPIEETEESEGSGINALFQEPESSKNNQEKIIKDNFLIKATDILEIIIKKSQNILHKLKVYETLILSLRAASKIKEKQHLVGKFASILQKVHKKSFDIKEEHEKELTSLIYLCIKGMYRDKNLNKILSKNFSSLLKALENINNEESLKIIIELLTKFFEKHNSNIKHECLIEIVSKYKYHKQIFLKLLGYLKKGRNPLIQVQSAEVIKSGLKQWKINNSKYLKKLIKIGKIVEKQECKLKLKNNILKNILGCLLILSKTTEVVYEEFVEDIDKLKLFLGERPNFHGLFLQIKNNAKKN